MTQEGQKALTDVIEKELQAQRTFVETMAVNMAQGIVLRFIANDKLPKPHPTETLVQWAKEDIAKFQRSLAEFEQK